MRIAILSMQRVVNFGSVLQAWALREMIHEVTGEIAEFLDIEESPVLASQGEILSDKDYCTSAYYSQHILQKVKRRIVSMASRYNKKLIKRFMEKELHLDTACSQRNYDHVVVGSDEVFNHTNGVRLQLHGMVRQARNVMTYAASCGSAKPEDVRPEDVQVVCNVMKRFASVSVRDRGTARYVNAFYEGKVIKHMDPVLMSNLYSRKPRKVWLKRYLLVYAYGQRIRTKEEIEAIRAFAKKKRLKVVAIGGSQFWCDLYIPVSPMRMLDWFANADYVVTDTFHGVVFSVINQRKFVVIVRPSNENKLTCLTEDLALTQRCLKNPSMLESLIEKPIDYDTINFILNRERNSARSYLKESLSNE